VALVCGEVPPRTSGGQIEEIARTFGVDWPHLTAQLLSFGLVCALLYWLYRQPLRRREARVEPGSTEEMELQLASADEAG